jgi:para-aminobenzoate synthetase component 1
MDPPGIRQAMNQLGAWGRPFLFAVDFELSEGLFSDHPFSEKKFFFSLWGRGNKPERAPEKNEARLDVFPVPFEAYAQKFEVVSAGLRRGDSYLTNLTVRTPIESSLSLEDIFLLSDSPYQLFLPGRFVCFSPERFVKIENRRIYACPMKGTIDASIPGAERKILSDFKESAEHATIVDLLRNDLGFWASEVEATRYRFIDLIRTRQRDILQVSSEISGLLPPDCQERLGDIIFSMLPAGSCSGAPKKSTVAIIQKAEGRPRGFYTGVFGLFDGQSLDSGVLIRFIEEENGRKFFRSGGGVTAYSVIEDEYREALDKIYLPFV